MGQPEQPAQPRHSEEPESPRWPGARRRGGSTQDAHAERDDRSPEHLQDPRSVEVTQVTISLGEPVPQILHLVRQDPFLLSDTAFSSHRRFNGLHGAAQ
jgi:hypothetical protein